MGKDRTRITGAIWPGDRGQGGSRALKAIMFLLGLWPALLLAKPHHHSVRDSEKELCVQLWYDSVPSAQPRYYYGRSAAIMVQNLLGHFPQFSQKIIPVEQYKKGDLDRCSANLYVGTYYDNEIPEAFLDDVVLTSSSVAWMGTNGWKLGNSRLKTLWDVRYSGLSTLDWKNVDAKGRPGFFKLVDYKGETFTKYGELDKNDPKQFYSAQEITLLDLLSEAASSYVVSWVRHNTVSAKRPYVLSHAQKWFIADLPISYITEDDRYLVFSDVLFDILGAKPRYPGPKRPAMFRLEDIHPKVAKWQLQGMLDIFTEAKVNYAISVIPIFADPYGVFGGGNGDRYLELPDSPDVVNFLTAAVRKGGSIIQHGVSHQYENLQNPQGVSGVDFEFWDTTRNSPVPLDSPDFVIPRMEKGLGLLNKVGFKPAAWVTPHYVGSGLDQILFRQLFSWQAGRIGYAAIEKAQAKELPALLNFDLGGVESNGQRLSYFKDLSVRVLGRQLLEGQFFPYELYGDYHGNRVIPENVGFIQSKSTGMVSEDLENVDRMVSRLKRNLVLRDVWGSFFLHPFLLEQKSDGTVADPFEVRRLIKSAQDLGYEFIDLKTWSRKKLTQGLAKVSEIPAAQP